MHHQFYDSEEESEPRITPKPISKFNHFAVPAVPDVSLIFERPGAASRNDGSNDPSSARSTKTVGPLDDTVNTVRTSVSAIWRDHDSYACWKEQNYHRAGISTSTAHSLPSRKNVYNHGYDHRTKPRLQGQAGTRDNRRKSVIDTRVNDGTSEKSVKFQCPDDSYDLGPRTRLSSLEGQTSCISLRRATRGTNDGYTTSDNVIPDALKRNERLQAPYSRYHPQFCLPDYSNYTNNDNNETVKTLLRALNDQSKQIKNLQLQIDTLVRMQEESFRNRSACACRSPSHVANQVFRYPTPMNYHDDGAVGSPLAQCPTRDAKASIGPQARMPAIESEDPITLDDSNKLETVQPLEQPSKKAFMEQKVSIGVMTSFEFTVQNSPFLMEPEMYEKKEAPRETNKINTRNVNATHVHDTSEPAKRYKNTFVRSKPGAAQLENIVEDSESHLSSSQQQSSNFNASSMRDSDRHSPRQSDLYNNAASALESSQMHQHPAADFNRNKTREEMCAGSMDGNMDEQLRNVRRILDASANVDYICDAGENYGKAAVIDDMNADYTAIVDGKGRNDTVITDMRSSSHAFNVHPSATDSYRLLYKNKERASAKERNKDVGDSVTLSGGDLRVLERPPPTPEPSIHVEMQEYTSDDESERLKRTSKIGWTFYNNVLGQVNEILQNSSIVNEVGDENGAKITHKAEQENDAETKTALDTVKAATLEQLRRLGISLTENNNEHGESNGNNKTLDFDPSFYPRLDRQANMLHTTSVVNETNTSMHMKALALKYLSDEQLADIALHKQESSSLKHLLLSNMEGTNMSLATMRYLERYQLLPGKNNVQVEGTDRMHGEVAPKADLKPAVGKNSPALRRFPFVRTPGTNCPNRILDLSTLKRQPKLL